MVASRFSEVLRVPTVRAELLPNDRTDPNDVRLPVLVHEEAPVSGLTAPIPSVQGGRPAH
jgi:hypothetical protein